MENLVTIAKEGEASLRIHVESLAQHVKLGWSKVEDPIKADTEQVEERAEAVSGRGKKNASKADE